MLKGSGGHLLKYIRLTSSTPTTGPHAVPSSIHSVGEVEVCHSYQDLDYCLWWLVASKVSILLPWQLLFWPRNDEKYWRVITTGIPAEIRCPNGLTRKAVPSVSSGQSDKGGQGCSYPPISPVLLSDVSLTTFKHNDPIFDFPNEVSNMNDFNFFLDFWMKVVVLVRSGSFRNHKVSTYT